MSNTFMLSSEQLYQAANEIKAEISLLRYKNERAKEILQYLTELYFEKQQQNDE